MCVWFFTVLCFLLFMVIHIKCNYTLTATWVYQPSKTVPRPLDLDHLSLPDRLYHQVPQVSHHLPTKRTCKFTYFLFAGYILKNLKCNWKKFLHELFVISRYASPENNCSVKLGFTWSNSPWTSFKVQFPQVISHILYIDTSESYDLFIFNLWQFLDRVEGEEMEILLFQLNNIHALLVW